MLPELQPGLGHPRGRKDLQRCMPVSSGSVPCQDRGHLYTPTYLFHQLVYQDTQVPKTNDRKLHVMEAKFCCV